MKYFYTLFGILLLTIQSCNLRSDTQEQVPLARVNDAFLYESDIDFSFVEGQSEMDSIIYVQNIINNWATTQLLIDGAVLNLKKDTQTEFEQLVQQYKSDLYTSAYVEALVNKNLDTLISDQELDDVYNNNTQLFVLKEDLLKMRYVNVNSKLSNLDEVKKRFKRFNAEDKVVLDSIAIQFNSFYLKDSIWIKSEQVISKIKPLQLGFNKVLLKKPNFIQLKDSLGLYLMQVNEVLKRGSQAPKQYVLPTLKQIVINKRKLKLIKQLKSDIVNDAIKNKNFEIYN
ncbi:MAG: peptidyl-prolyl cis-trans isomerase [Flavobacteriaceae bacterium]|nr:peptidyl-prolyl cis-trans isomerase [Flavobacteriaceae bacterium]MDG1043022.1 peptidyl-prolyl cis-trans isomerase [Flavobacteriaceae bacterium]MDG1794428.1 peptidyl-prolyl cis-trans isomerase [Flavobacteriaceae bacterium]